MGRRRRSKESNLFFSEHHLTPKSKGGKRKDKTIVPHNKHIAWHTLVKNSLPEKAANILSDWIHSEYRFFAVNKNYPYSAVKEINSWIDGNFKLKIKEKSKIIKFRSAQKITQFIPKIVS